MSNNKKIHGFCVTPEEKCTMNFCDENGCFNRRRNLVGEPIEMSNNKQSSVEWLIAEIQRRVAIIQSEPQTMARELMINNLAVDLEQAKAMHKEEIEKTIDMSRNLCKISDIDGYDEYQFTKEEILEKILKVTENE